MIKLNVWQWIGIALIILAIVGCVVMTYKAPIGSIILVVGFLGGMATMWLLKMHKIVNKTYDEVTKEDSEVRCIGYDPKSICERCCYREDYWCDFYKTQASNTKTDCEAWEPKIEL